MSALARPEAMRGRIEVRLEHRLEDVLQRCLHDPVAHRWDAEAAKLPRLSRFGDLHTSNWTRPVTSGAELRAYVLDECIHPIAKDLPHGEPVYAGRAAAPIPGYPRDRDPQVAFVC